MNSSFSFLRRRRFTKNGKHRGVSLIELTIGIAVLALIIGVTIVTVTQRATSARMESYAGQVGALIKQRRNMISENLAAAVTAQALAAQVDNLFNGIDEIGDVTGSATGPNDCTGAAGAVGAAAATEFVLVVDNGAAGNEMTNAELDILAGTLQDALTTEFDIAVTDAAFGDTFVGGTAGSGPPAGHIFAKRMAAGGAGTAGNPVLHICFE